MAEKRIGLTAKLRFMAGSAISKMGRVNQSFLSMGKSVKRFKTGLSQMKQGFDGISKLGMATGAGIAFAASRLLKFDESFASVKAVLLASDKSNSKYIASLKKKAQDLGKSTKFTAAQAAKAMENLARAGLKPKEILKAITPLLHTAAAENMGLGEAAGIVSSNLKIFGLKADKARKVSDLLATVSAKTNTNMRDLQEGMKYAGPVASSLKVPFKDTAAILGLMADNGLKGSTGGTALKNALIKLAKASKDGKVPVGDISVALVRTKDGGLSASKSMFAVAKALKQIKDPVKRSAAGIALLGIRGFSVASAFLKLHPESDRARELFNNLEDASKGAAKKMADIKSDTLKGELTKLESATDGLLQSFAETFDKGLRKHIKAATSVISQAGKAFDVFSKKPELLNRRAIPAIKGVSSTITGVVKGVLEGINSLKKMYNGLVGTIKKVAEQFGIFGKSGVQDVAKVVTEIAGISAALVGTAGVIIAVKTVGGAFLGLGKMAVGASKVIVGAFGLVTASLKGVGKAGLVAGGGLKKAVAAMGKGLMGTSKLVGSFGKACSTGIKRLALFTGSMLKAKGKIAKFGGAVAVVGLAFYKFGQWLDKRFNFSGKAADWLDKITGRKAARDAKGKKIAKARRKALTIGGIADTLRNWQLIQKAARRKGGHGSIRFKHDPTRRHRLTKEFAKQYIRDRLASTGYTKKKLEELARKDTPAGRQALKLLELIHNTLATFPSKFEFKPVIKMDSRKVSSQIKKSEQDRNDRGATSNNRRQQ